MENVLLVILLILALALIAVVLLQRSEGGGLGIGGGGGGVMSARGAATALGKITWGLGIAFLAMSLAMTVVSARNAADSSVIDRVEGTAPATDAPAVPGTALPTLEDLVPQTDSAPDAAADAPAEAPAEAPATGDAEATPPRAD
ncbi:MAG: preprotein translocase subunit SecG [Maritimibacter sp.]|nr:preprotein translocase subunit SecG [Maritimibacter sp.]